MLEVFKEQVINKTKQKVNDALEILENENELQRQIRELAYIETKLEKINVIIDMDEISYEDWIVQKDELRVKSDTIYSEFLNSGFEKSWISTIVMNEKENYSEIMGKARAVAYKKAFGTVQIKDIDVFDKRWSDVEQHINKARADYIMGQNYESNFIKIMQVS